MKDPYETLRVERSATDNEIKDAFKKLARKFHPDLHPDDKEAEEKFKDISAANDLLKDKEKRRRFDAGEIAASGAQRPQERFYRDFADGPAYASHAAQDGFANNEELEEFLARAFAGRGRRSQGSFRARGEDVSYVLPVGFLDAANGATRTITLPEGNTLQVTIPEGAEDRQMLRLKEQGMPGFGGGPAGDAYVELHVEPHPFFRRKDDNIHVEVPYRAAWKEAGHAESHASPSAAASSPWSTIVTALISAAGETVTTRSDSSTRTRARSSAAATPPSRMHSSSSSGRTKLSPRPTRCC
jgi:DnaJ-class molecular chaperone